MKNPLWKQPGLSRMIVLTVISVGLFIAQLIMSHITHSLSLLVAAYHMLYNILSLVGCIATIKMCQRVSSIHNTFGWARLEVLSMVANLLLLFALDFSIVIEAVQTLIHSDHMDAMHRPGIICILACIGILLNGFCTLLVGGFTHHQGSFLSYNPSGDLVIQRGAASEQAVRQGLRRLASPERPPLKADFDETVQSMAAEEQLSASKACGKTGTTDIRMVKRWPTMHSVFRDNASSVIVLVSAIVVYVCGESLASLMIDPLLTIVSVVILTYTSWPFMLQAGQILLQTTPAHIDVAELEASIKNAFPSVVNIHELHVWALTPDKVIATAHLVFVNEIVYLRIKEPIYEFFLDQGITRVTLQPEFYTFEDQTPDPRKRCVLTCNAEHCSSMTCCNHHRSAVQEDATTPSANDVESGHSIGSSRGDCSSHHHHEESIPLTDVRLIADEDSSDQWVEKSSHPVIPSSQSRDTEQSPTFA